MWRCHEITGTKWLTCDSDNLNPFAYRVLHIGKALAQKAFHMSSIFTAVSRDESVVND
jgi:hypothetical protein